jgi:diamine N-acetyltransferase
MNKTITLVPVSKHNWQECAFLELPPSQSHLLASNLLTIAESKFEPHYILHAIQRDQKVVGMLAYCQEIDEPTPDVYWLFRIMIAAKHQGNGHGRAAAHLAIEKMVAVGARTIRTMHRPDNEVAARLYRSLGFIERGYLDDGDILLELTVEEGSRQRTQRWPTR